jgi:hypothetical protein
MPRLCPRSGCVNGCKQTACCVRCAGDHYSSSNNRGAAVHDHALMQLDDQFSTLRTVSNDENIYGGITVIS